MGQINSLIETLNASHDQLDRTFRFKVIPGGRMWVEIDEVKLLQVINNLLSNAAKITHAGGIITLTPHQSLYNMKTGLENAFT